PSGGGLSWGRRFFFQAEDGIRDFHVTGVQTCALPISHSFQRGTPSALPTASQTAVSSPASATRLTRRSRRMSRVTGCPSSQMRRSEERRVGKEGGAGGSGDQQREQASGQISAADSEDG